MALTPKQEAFARHRASGMTQSDAYREAFDVGENTKPETVHKRASELMAKGEIAGRIAELQNDTLDRYRATLDDLLDELEQARSMAIKTGKAAAMVAASMGKAKLLGLEAPSKMELGGELSVHQVRRVIVDPKK